MRHLTLVLKLDEQNSSGETNGEEDDLDPSKLIWCIDIRRTVVQKVGSTDAGGGGVDIVTKKDNSWLSGLPCNWANKKIKRLRFEAAEDAVGTVLL